MIIVLTQIVYFSLSFEDTCGLKISISISGHRSVPLKNAFSEEIPLAALLVQIEMRNAQVI